MFSSIFDAWREIAHIAAWTGLSVGTLVGIAAVIYFEPPARHLAFAAAAIVIAIYGATIYGNHIGSVDMKAQWNAANAKATAQSVARDQQAPAVADADIEIKSLRQQAQADMELINALRKADGICHPLSVDQLR